MATGASPSTVKATKSSGQQLSTSPPIVLPLTVGPSRASHSLASIFHTLFTTLALFLRLPFHLTYHYVLFRRSSPLVQELGRPAFVQVGLLLTKLFFLEVYLAAGRPVFSTALVALSPWVGKKVKVSGTRGRWVRPPETDGKRGEDEVVLLWVHGGGFNYDVAGSCLPFHLLLAKLVNRSARFSIFLLDYSLAPEHIYPSQLIEALAAYHHLVNVLGIAESKICIGGDSAGGNIVSGLLLHLARPNPRLRVPVALGKTPGNPGFVLLISPYNSLVSSRPSRTPPYPADFLDSGGVFRGALAYVGAGPPYPPPLATWRDYSPSWNSRRWFSDEESSETPPPVEQILREGLTVEWAESQGGISLFNSPYVNPGPEAVKDLDWYREAFPGDGRTLVASGGKEILVDDISAFVEALKQAGVAPTELYKPLAVHDWPIFDSFIPFFSRDKNGGEQSKWNYGLKQIAKFLVEQVEGGKGEKEE